MKDVGQWKVAESLAQQSINAKAWRNNEELVGVTTRAEVCKELLKKETDYQKKKQGYVEGTSTLYITKLLFILERHKCEAVDDAALEVATNAVEKAISDEEKARQFEAAENKSDTIPDSLATLIEKNKKENKSALDMIPEADLDSLAKVAGTIQGLIAAENKANGKTLKYLQTELQKYNKNTGVAPPPPVMGGGGGPPPPPPPPPPGGRARGIKKGGGKGGASNKRVVASKKVNDAKMLRQQLRKSLRPSEQSWWSVRPPPSRAWHLSS